MTEPPAQPARKSDWKTQPLPAKRAHVRLDRLFSAAEAQRLRLGLLPREQEDKWFMYFEGQTLHIHRSWTGVCIYEVSFMPEGGGLRAVQVQANRDPDQYGETDDEKDSREVLWLLEHFLLS